MRASAKKMLAQGPVEGKWNLPVGWEWKRLVEVAEVNPRSLPRSVDDDEEISFVPMAAVAEIIGAISTSDVRPFGTVKKGYTKFAENDVLFAKITPCMENGKTCVAKKLMNGIGCGSTEFHVIRTFGDILPKYIWHYLVRAQYRQDAQHNMQGAAGQLRVPPDYVRESPIPLPPTVQDQERIVERIDSLFAELDKAEETLRHTITLCEQYKQSVLKAAVTGELSKEWRRTNPPKETGEQLLQHILKERRAAWEKAELAKMTAKGQKPVNDSWKKKYKEPQVPDTSGLPALPEGWTWASVDALSLEVQYGTSEKANDDSSGVPVLRMGNIVDGALTWDKLKYLPENEDTLSLLLNDGDLLFNRTNSLELVGKTAVFREQRKVTFASYLIRVVTCGIEPELLSSYINSAIGREWIISVASQQVGQANVNGSKLKQLFVPVPSQKEQSVICNKIQHLIESKVNLLKRIQYMLRQTAALRQSILKQAFTGKLV